MIWKKIKRKNDKHLDQVSVPENDSDSNGDVLAISTGTKYFSKTWIMHSGCSYHMCPYREWFDTYLPYNG